MLRSTGIIDPTRTGGVDLMFDGIVQYVRDRVNRIVLGGRNDQKYELPLQ